MLTLQRTGAIGMRGSIERLVPVWITMSLLLAACTGMQNSAVDREQPVPAQTQKGVNTQGEAKTDSGLGAGSEHTLDSEDASASTTPAASHSSLGSSSAVSSTSSSSISSSFSVSSAEPLAVLNPSLLLTEGALGFADASGSRLLVDSPSEGKVPSQGYNLAVGYHGQRLAVRYMSVQERNDADNGRQTAQNFDYLPGSLYEIIEGKATPNETYFLTMAQDMPEAAQLGMTSIREEQTPAALVSRLDNTWKRQIQHIWPLEQIDSQGKLYLVQFEPKGQELLASLVLDSKDGLIVQDYPAQLEGYSAWRVDDGGEVLPEMFSFLWAARTPQGFMLGVQWMGAEGESVTFLSREQNQFTELDVTYGRYMSPL